MATITNLSVSLKADTRGISKGLTKAKKEVKGFAKSITGLQAGIATAIGFTASAGLLTGIIATNTEMQTLKSSLKTVTGSAEGAATAFAKIEKFAVTTPFDLNQWTQAFIKMKSLGLDPSEQALNSYGNTAAAMGKSLNQMIEAVSDAASSEFERLKEFGIKAKKQGEQVTFTFQGVKTTVKNEAAEIEGYLQSIGNNQFGGAMADQMNNLAPAFSNLKQSFQTLAVKIGEAGLNEMITDLTHSITDFVNGFSDSRLHTIQNFFKGIGEAFGWISNVVNAITFLQGRGMLEQFEANNPSQIGNLAPAQNNFQLGDFNRSGGNADRLLELRRIDSARDNKTAAAMQENTKFTEQILEAIRAQSTAARAG